MRERNWGLILGVLSGFAIFGVAILSGVSEETAAIRSFIGAAVGGFIGMGFNYLGASAVQSSPLKGGRFDMVLPETEASHGTGPSPSEAGAEFVPMDLGQAARVVEQLPEEG